MSTVWADRSCSLFWICGHLVETTFQANSHPCLCQAASHLMGVTKHVETSCCLSWNLWPFSKWYMACWGWLLLIWGLSPWRDFSKVGQHKLREATCVEKLLEVAGARHLSWVGRDSGHHQDRAHWPGSWRAYIRCLSVRTWWRLGGLSAGAVAPANASVPVKHSLTSAPLALAVKLVISVPSCKPLAQHLPPAPSWPGV